MVNPVLGLEPDPTRGPVRAFYAYPGFEICYRNLNELRQAMIVDDITIIHALANRNAGERTMSAGHGARNFTIRSSDTARNKVPEIIAQRHPHEEGLREVVTAVYVEVAEESSAIQWYDYLLVSGLATRLNKAKQAVVFKLDRAEGLAPHTQHANQERAVALARAHYPDDLTLAEHVQRVYSVLVPANVAIQQTMFDRTYLLANRDDLRHVLSS